MQIDFKEAFMALALSEANRSLEINEVPVGAVVVLNNKVIGKGFNTSISKNDSTRHAEIEAIRRASGLIGNYRLTGADLYVTLEPCSMCYGAIVHSRISNIFFGAHDLKTGVCGSCADFSKFNFYNHKPLITGGIMEEKCSKILKDFFKAKRS